MKEDLPLGGQCSSLTNTSDHSGNSSVGVYCGAVIPWLSVISPTYASPCHPQSSRPKVTQMLSLPVGRNLRYVLKGSMFDTLTSITTSGESSSGTGLLIPGPTGVGSVL